MPKVIVTLLDGSQTTLESKSGISVMQVLRNGGIDELLALCGGSCSCATCHVYVDAEFADKLPKMSIEEDELLSASEHRTERSRLSCQLPFGPALDGLKVTVAPEE
jgi:2Fe-2S ferredoxin